MSRNYLEALIVFIVALGIAVFLTWPRFEQLTSIMQQIGQKETEIKNRQEYYASLEMTASDLKQYQASLAKINSAFPLNEDAPSLMNFIQAAAVESGLIMKNIDYSKVEAVNNLIEGEAENETEAAKRILHKYGVAANFSGSYESFKDFVLKIGKSSRIIEINSAIIKKAETQEGAEKAKNKTAGDITDMMDFQLSFSVDYY